MITVINVDTNEVYATCASINEAVACCRNLRLNTVAVTEAVWYVEEL